MKAKDALEILLEGNSRYREGRPRGEGRGAGRRAGTAGGQKPAAVILSCSDSRVPPEIIFDLGIGDLFVVRVAGNVEDDLVTASIEYAAAHLAVPLLLVLGHTRCGAVTAAVSGAGADGHAGAFLGPIGEAVLDSGGEGSDRVDAAARRNALMTAGRLRGSGPVLAPLVDAGMLVVRAALYDIETGAVTLLED